MGYRGKVDEQGRARDLRALGWTLAEICCELGVSKSSASLWCRDVEVDAEVLAARRRWRYLRGNEGARRRGPNALQRRKQADIEAAGVAGRAAVGQLSARDLRMAALGLYAGEGGKTQGAVVFANTNPLMVGLFLRWLRTEFVIDERRLRGRLYLHEGLDLDAAEDHWAGVSGIPRAQFQRAYRAAPDPSIRRSKHPMGCFTAIYHCSWTHRRVLGMVEALLGSPFQNVPG